MMKLSMMLLLVSCQRTANAFSSRASQPMTPRRGSSLNMGMEASAMLTALDTFYQTKPFEAAFITCACKASAADFITQKRQDNTPNNSNKQQEIDMSRNLAFIIYGGIYQGCFQQFLYNTLFPMFFGTEVSLVSVVEQVAVDMLAVTPLLCLPMAYLVKASMNTQESFQQGLEKYFRHVQEEGLLFKYWMLWIPVQSITFGLIPEHLRIVFIACVSFVWLMILSQISSTSEQTTTRQSSS